MVWMRDGYHFLLSLLLLFLNPYLLWLLHLIYQYPSSIVVRVAFFFLSFFRWPLFTFH